MKKFGLFFSDYSGLCNGMTSSVVVVSLSVERVLVLLLMIFILAVIMLVLFSLFKNCGNTLVRETA